MLVDGDSKREELLLRVIFVVGQHELAQALRFMQLGDAKLTLADSAVEDGELLSRADDEQRIFACDNLVCTRHVDSAMVVQQLQDVAAIVLAEVERFKALACHRRACINCIIGELQILVEPFCIRIACAFTVLAHMLFVKVDEKARFDAQIFAHEPVGGGNHVACDEHCAAGQKAVEAEDNMEDEVQRCGSNEHFAEEQNEQRQMVGTLFEPQLRK